MQALIGGALASAAAKEAGKTATHTTQRLCREVGAVPLYGVYRQADERDTYLVAIGDSGRIATVSRTIPFGDRPAGYAVAMHDLDGSTLNYPEFDRRPAPEQVIDAVLKSAPISRVSKDGKAITLPNLPH